MLLVKGLRVELRIYKEGLKNIRRFEGMLNRNIYLRLDVILAIMPPLSKIIINPYTNHKIVSWVIDSPFKYPHTLKVVKPFNKIEEFHK